MKKNLLLLVFFASAITAYSQLLLEASGPGSTYEHISNKLGPGYNPVEHLECIHPEFTDILQKFGIQL